MGKTYRNVSAGSRSEDFHSPSNRGLMREKVRHSHHSNRNKNRDSDESTFESFNCQLKTAKNFGASGYSGPQSNVANFFGWELKDELRKDYSNVNPNLAIASGDRDNDALQKDIENKINQIAEAQKTNAERGRAKSTLEFKKQYLKEFL